MLNFRRFFSQPRGTHPHQTRNRRTRTRARKFRSTLSSPPPPPKVWCCLLALMMVGTVQGHLGLKSWTSSCWTDLTKGFSFTKPANISSKVGGIWDQQPAEVFIFPSSFNTCFKTYSCLLCLLFHFFLVVCRFKHDNMCCLLTRYLLITFYIAA